MKTHYNLTQTAYLFVLILAIFLFPISIHAQSKSEYNHSKEIITDRSVPSKVIDSQRVEDGTGIVRAVYWPDFVVNNGDPEEMARQYLNAHVQALLQKSSTDDLEHSRTIETPGGYKVHFTQKAAGYFVYDATITVSINRNNEVVFVTDSYKPLGKLQTEINTSAQEAVITAKKHIGISGKLDFEKVEALVYSQGRMGSEVAYKVNLIPAEDHFGDWELIIDAKTGEILRAEDKACYSLPDGDGVQVNGSGWVFDPDPVTNAKTMYGANQFTDNNDSDSDSLTAQLKTVMLHDISFDGSMYRLEGPYTVIADFELPYTGLYEQSSSDFHYTRSNESFEAVNAYFHLDKSMRYMNETLGFSVMPFQYTGGVQFDPQGLNGDNNAHYISAGKIAFGSPANGVDTGEDPTVIIHELGHGLHDWITNGGLSQVDGLSEGLADYWAQSYTRSLGIYEPGDEAYDYLGTWGGMPGFGPPSLRITNYEGHYPESMNGEVHHDGQMWASSLMSIYDLIGKEATDMDCWEGISMLNATSNQVDAAFAFSQADINLYDGDHLEDIFNVFYERGYLASPLAPSFTADQPNGEGPREVVFTDKSFSLLNQIVSWEWDFNHDGEIDSYDQNPTYTFTEPGGYTIALTVSDGEFSKTLVKENYISVNSGFFVFEGSENQHDYSGAFIRDFLVERGYDVIYSNYFPSSLIGFDAAFLSFGNYDSGSTTLENHMANTIIGFLESDGSVYMEGADVLGFDQPGNSELFELFGVASTTDGSENPINLLEGLPDALTSDMVFTGNSQISNSWIDIYTPSANGIAAFIEEDYGTVAVQNSVPDGQSTFCFSYALSKLNDEDPHTSRYNILIKLLKFFGYPEENNYVVANFTADETDLLPGEEIQFTDWSISDEGYTVNSWFWDFDEDGIIDSDEQNPVWSYNIGGVYNIMLVVSNGQSTDTLIRSNLILVRSGIFVYAGEENGVDLSGTFIRNYLQDNGYEVVYANHFPSSLIGFDAVFASFGSAYYTGPVINVEMTSSLIAYGQQGGHIYIEGAEALGNAQGASILLWFVFGIDNIENGIMNPLNLLQGQEGSIMYGMEFAASDQLDISNIDIYEPNPDLPTSEIAFVESDYGTVAVQFDGTAVYGQKTFCMSYTMADLEDGDLPNTREELLYRVLNFFDFFTSIPEEVESNISLYPNPTHDYLNIPGSTSKLVVSIYDVLGNKIITEQNTERVDVRFLKRGIYLVTLSDGYKSTSHKFIKN